MPHVVRRPRAWSWRSSPSRSPSSILTSSSSWDVSCTQGLLQRSPDAYQVAVGVQIRVRVPARKGSSSRPCASAPSAWPGGGTVIAEEALRRPAPRGASFRRLHVGGRPVRRSGGGYKDALVLAPKDARAPNGLARVSRARASYAEALESRHGGVWPRTRAIRNSTTRWATSTNGWAGTTSPRNPSARFINLLPVGRDERAAAGARGAAIPALVRQASGRTRCWATRPGLHGAVPRRGRQGHRAGQGQRRPAGDFVVDTGAEMASLTRPTAERQA